MRLLLKTRIRPAGAWPGQSATTTGYLQRAQSLHEKSGSHEKRRGRAAGVRPLCGPATPDRMTGHAARGAARALPPPLPRGKNMRLGHLLLTLLALGPPGALRA